MNENIFSDNDETGWGDGEGYADGCCLECGLAFGDGYGAGGCDITNQGWGQ